MNIDTNRVRGCLRRFDFDSLFVEELNWNICRNRPVDVDIDGQAFKLTPFAEQGGMVIYLAGSSEDGNIPPSNLRRIIERRIMQQTHEHIIIFVDDTRTKSVWQWVSRQSGKQTAAREHTYYKGQPGDSLLQKLAGIAFSIDDLDEEGKVAITEVTGRVAKAFDVEKVTRRFYDEFKTEHSNFSNFLKGLEGQDDLGWYTSVMLDRLMFIYFIQKKGFLDGDIQYLANKLKESKARGANQFYRKFLIRLFFEGFAKEEKDRPPDVNQLLGHVPYLNGGLFLPHQLELAYRDNIDISNAAFERLFAFFDRYSWHLDYRPQRADNEIDPDVLGYIFEKYINQKQMGAYYTKEDITDYISKNTIIPFLFDKLETMHYDELHPLPMADVEPYIYKAVKQEDYLPTETDREYEARQKRYHQIKEDFAAGKIANINDLITYNLDIRKFAEDWARGIKDPVTLRAFYFHCLTKVTILDPAAGSGAFLFAALNLLEPLYEICLDRMEELSRPKYEDFDRELERINQHPNRKYFVFKSIIVNNLFGVDIMEEAVEICKLRLFLKLVAQVDDVEKIEPLPDIDFNIRAGNTLVGYVNHEEITKAKTTKLDLSGALKGIEEKIKGADRALQNFREMQIRFGVPASQLAQAKGTALDRLGEIQQELDKDLAAFYGATDTPQFTQTHQPFHWFVEFYGIMKDGGFDVIIGNPPYVEYTKVKDTYRVRGCQTESCGNLYAFMVERSYDLLRLNGRFGMIVPVSIASSDRMSPIRARTLTCCSTVWMSHFAIRPQPLFADIMQRNTVIITQTGKEQYTKLFSTNYLRWTASERDFLFKRLRFAEVSGLLPADDVIPKVATDSEANILKAMIDNSATRVGKLQNTCSELLFFHDSGESYWTKALLEKPPAYRNGLRVEPSQWFTIGIPLKDKPFLYLLLNSNLLYWLWTVYTDCRHMTQGFIRSLALPSDRTTDPELVDRLTQAYAENTRLFEKRPGYKSPEIKVQNFKSLIDEIDRVLAKHYGFTEEELDFIINYDIKYRMGKDNDEEEED